MRPDVVADYSCETAEGPLWDERAETLYWIGIYGGQLFEYSPATDQHGVVHEDGVLGGLTLQEDGSFLLFEEAGEVRRLDDGTVTTVVKGVEADDHTRYNDCIADPEGRVFCGTKGNNRGPGRLYRLDTDGASTSWRTTSGYRTGSDSRRTERRCTTLTPLLVGSTSTTTTDALANSRTVSHLSTCPTRPGCRTD